MQGRFTPFLVVLSLFVACAMSHPYDMGIVFEDTDNAMQGDQPPRQTTGRPHLTTESTHTTTNAAHVTLPPFTPNETLCFAQKKVMYAADGKCYTLRQRGPCPAEDQWLVLDKEEAVRERGSLRPVCQTCACCQRVRQVYWPADGACHKLSESGTLCPFEGNYLQSDPFGEGECVCKKDPPHARYEPHVLNNTNAGGVCYPLYHRGPCESGHVLTKSSLKGYGNVGVCTRDPCHQQNSHSRNGTFAQFDGDRRCYLLGKTGEPCASDESFNVDSLLHRPQCIRRQNNIFKLPERCQTNTSGDCQKEVNLSEDDKTLFALELLMSADKRKKRRTRNGLDE